MSDTAAQQLLRDPEVSPTGEVLASALGDSYAAYEEFIDTLGRFDVEAEWRYYSDGKAWLAKGMHRWKTSRGTDKEKTVFWLSVWDGFFKLSFFIGEKFWADAQNLPLSEAAKQVVASGKKIGKLKFYAVIFDIRSDGLLNDLSKLIEFQKSIK